jgi:hypothetical protein
MSSEAIDKLRRDVMELPAQLGPTRELVGFVLVGVARSVFDGEAVAFRSVTVPLDAEEAGPVLEALRDALEAPIEGSG